MADRGAKVVLLGEMGVGKSSIAGRTQNNIFLDSYQATIGATFATKHLADGDRQYKFYIWDTAGKEKFRALAPLYYRDATAAILVYDISAKASFDCIPYWISELRKHGPPNIILVLAGNKCDCGDELREIPFRFLASYATEKGIPYFECSAKTGENVREILVEIGRQLPPDFVTTKRETTRLLDPAHTGTLCWPLSQSNCSII